MNKLSIFTLLFLFLSFTVYCQEKNKKKKKGFFAKIAEAFKPVPGELGAHNIDDYFNSITHELTDDPEHKALRADTNTHVVFPAKLGVYDEQAGGFPIILGRYDHPYLKTSNRTYYFLLRNINQFRFFSFSKDKIINDRMKHGSNLALKFFFKADTAYENRKKARIIDGSIHKTEVVLLGDNYYKNEIAVIKEPHIYGESLPPYYANLEDTQLNNYFKHYPFYTDEDWPRVSITFTHFPEIYRKNVMQNSMDKSIVTGNRNGTGIIKFDDFGTCYMNAVIWKSETEKIEIPEFSWHPYDFTTFNTPTDEIGGWGLGSVTASLKENTGYQRTEGPIPPRYPFPQTPHNHKDYAEYSTGGALVIADILNKMGFDWNKRADRRVWFNIKE